MERAAKLLVIVSMGAALALQLALVSWGWGGVRLTTVALCVGAAAVAAVAEGVAVAGVLLFAFIFPAAVLIGHGAYGASLSIVWTAAWFGAMAPRALRSGWSVPARWRGALTLWALTVALAWPIVALREIDFLPAVWNQQFVAASATSGPLSLTVRWTLNVATILGVGILWFDWLFAAMADDAARFRRFVLLPLAASAVAASAVATYQVFGDLLFLNNGLFGGMGRASGTMLDANAFGAVEALASAGILAWWLGAARSRWWLALPMLALAWIGLWGSGSRTALVAGLVPFAPIVWRLVNPDSQGDWRLRRRDLIVAATAAVALVALATTAKSPAVGAIQRLRDSLPSASVSSVEAFAREMWSRNGYGLAADAMTVEHPLVGVGVGSFHVMVSDYSQAAGVDYLLPPDNAQNWFRHQFAEFGLLGSVGWIAWVVLFGVFLWRAPIAPATRVPGAILKAALVGLALISLVGMPTQNVSVALMFWTLAFWFTQTTERPVEDPSPPLTRTAWTAIAIVLALFVAGTAYAARHELRPARRALAHGWLYSYGFSDPEPGADGLTYRWAAQRAVTVVPAPKPWMRLTVSVNHFDIAAHPVDARVWCDDHLILQTTLRTIAPVTEYVRLPEGLPRVMLETWVSRVVHPRDFGIADDRELGLFVHWDFVDLPPPGAATSAVTRR